VWIDSPSLNLTKLGDLSHLLHEVSTVLCRNFGSFECQIKGMVAWFACKFARQVLPDDLGAFEVLKEAHYTAFIQSNALGFQLLLNLLCFRLKAFVPETLLVAHNSQRAAERNKPVMCIVFS